jgi:hypothetical protein
VLTLHHLLGLLIATKATVGIVKDLSRQKYMHDVQAANITFAAFVAPVFVNY